MDVSDILKEQKNKFKSTEVEKLLPLDMDLGNLLASDVNELKDNILGGDKDNAKDEYLLELARDNTQLLFNSVFSRPTRSTDMGVLASLEPPSLVIPREKPIPKDKPLTRWEKFAKAKGIQNRKKSRMVFDEETGEYKPRWGYKGATEGKEGDWLIEVPEGSDPMEDQYQKAREEKKGRVEKNQKRQRRNLEEAAAHASGQDPVKARAARKELLSREIAISQSATASMGKFDKKLKGDQKVKGQKRKFDPNTADTSKERSSAMNILERMSGTKSGASSTTVNVRKVSPRRSCGKGRW
ncbi:MAG: ribosome biogenesis regulatory protein-domain-containing protein [Piptocephalis tieghemiana]|nr:MAG: ribosome biogenesis regulatory protein-domain-containing protein [Piptocephalis tieghemiana]